MLSKYQETGVDPRKSGTEVFETKGIFPHSFVPIHEDFDDPEYGRILHPDGAGSKTVQRYLHYRETGDINVFRGDAYDTVAMNSGDVYCVNGNARGFVDYVAINVNSFHLPKQEFLRLLNESFVDTFALLANYDIRIKFLGGETADLPDQVRTADVSGTIEGRVKLSEVITGEDIRPGYVIVGLRSDGQANWEDVRNSGIMSNGLTLARHCLMIPEYEVKYPEIRDPKGKEYYGKFRTDQYVDDLGMTVGEALISPTRLFAIPMKQLCNKQRISGLVHNTGGGQTKLLRIGNGIHYVKDNLPEPPAIFYLIQQGSEEEWRNMYEGFNMGVGVDVIVPPELEKYVIETAREMGIEAQRTGYCEDGNGKNSLTIKSKFGEFHYPEEKAA